MPSYTQSILSPDPVYLQTKTYDARADRKTIADIITPGVVGAGDYLVTGVSGNNISIAAGIAYVSGQNIADQGMYRQYIASAVAMTVTANGAANPRLDQVIIRIMDGAADSSGLYEGRIEIVPGTATAGATLINRLGAADLTTLLEGSKSVLLLGDVLAAASGGALSFGDRRTFVFVNSNLRVPACRLYHSANQSQTSGANGTLAWDTERYDNVGMHDPVTNNTRITAITSGKYNFKAQVAWAANVTGSRNVFITHSSGASVAFDSRPPIPVVSGATIQSCEGDWDMVAGEYVTIQVRQDSGGALDVSAGSGSTFAQAKRIGL